MRVIFGVAGLACASAVLNAANPFAVACYGFSAVVFFGLAVSRVRY